jgi:DNA repair protein RecO (recombination protein O)
MELDTPALVLAALPHGENGAVVRFLTPGDGLMAGYVRGARSRRLRPVLQPGNRVELGLRARVDSQLAAATVELSASRAGIAVDALGAAALDWLTAATAALLTEGAAHPRLYTALDALLGAMALGAEDRAVAAGVARYELLLLAELGFGLDLASCAATGATTDLAYVSPKSSRAVSRAAGAPYAARLLPLPGLLLGAAGTPDWSDVGAALVTTGFFVERDLLDERRAGLAEARHRLATIATRRGEPA